MASFSRVLLAERTGNSFVKVFDYPVRKNGTFPVALKWSGTLEGIIAKRAAIWIASQNIPVQWIDIKQGLKSFRVTLY